MPRLLVFAACEKVILDSDGLVSLITIIERIEVSVPKEIELGDHVAFPMRWQCIAIWTVSEDEIGKYEQMTEVVASDGIVSMHTEPATLVSTIRGSKTGVKMVGTLTAVPITDGPLTLRLLWREIGGSGWTEAAAYPIDVVVVRP
jgi:hypothetical protein